LTLKSPPQTVSIYKFLYDCPKFEDHFGVGVGILIMSAMYVYVTFNSVFSTRGHIILSLYIESLPRAVTITLLETLNHSSVFG